MTPYRVFMTLAFCVITAGNALSNIGASSATWGRVVGPVSVVIWILILLGGFGIGPMGALRKALGW